MFYDKEINIYTYGSLDDDNGIKRSKWSKKNNKPIECDVQPYSAEKLKKDYGYDLECTYRIYCDKDITILESDVILYNAETYKIQKIISWDDYYMIAILQQDYELEEIDE